MLNTILSQKGISAYALSQKSGVAYSTISDLMTGKRELQKTSADTLYKISRALDMSMEEVLLYEEEDQTFYLYNEERKVFIQTPGQSIQYLGPKNLLGFKRVLQVKNNVIYVDCYFYDKDLVIYCEEDYIDLQDLFEENHCTSLLNEPYRIILGQGNDSLTKRLKQSAFLVSDNIAMTIPREELPDLAVELTNVKRNKERMLLRLKDYAILSCNMSPSMQKRAIDSVKRNINLVKEELKEGRRFA